MISKAVVKYLRISPRKVREVIYLVRGKNADQALGILKNTNKKAAVLLTKLLNSAIANTKRLPNIREEDLYISSISADGGPSLKRFKAQALGRATMIKRRTSHITIELDMKEPKTIPVEKKNAKAKKEKPELKKKTTTDSSLKLSKATKAAKKSS